MEKAIQARLNDENRYRPESVEEVERMKYEAFMEAFKRYRKRLEEFNFTLPNIDSEVPLELQRQEKVLDTAMRTHNRISLDKQLEKIQVAGVLEEISRLEVIDFDTIDDIIAHALSKLGIVDSEMHLVTKNSILDDELLDAVDVKNALYEAARDIFDSVYIEFLKLDRRLPPIETDA